MNTSRVLPRKAGGSGRRWPRRRRGCWIGSGSKSGLEAPGEPVKLIEVASDRLLWGTDWPHGNIFEPRSIPNDGDLVDLLARIAPDETVRRQIFVDNPARLFGWSG